MSDKPNDKPESLIDRLNRRRARVAAESRGEVLPPVVGPADTDQEEVASSAAALPENDADDELSEAELLEKYDLPDPETIEDEAGLDRFFQGDMPDRLRRMALRRVWRLNPLFRFADEMVEYGEDYTDAATVVDGLQTAYQVGKGYLQKAKDKLDEMGGEEGLDGDTSLPASRDVDAGSGKGGTKEEDAAGTDPGDGSERDGARAPSQGQPTDAPGAKDNPGVKDNEDILPQSVKDISQDAGDGALVDAPAGVAKGEEESPDHISRDEGFYKEKQPLKPKRMAFKRPA
jgi:hypothetical protein